MWRNAGVVRNASRLGETRDILDFWGHYVMDKRLDHVTGWQVQNQLTVARLVAMAALARTESIGVHFREDGANPGTDVNYHLHITRNDEGTRVERVE